MIVKNSPRLFYDQPRDLHMCTCLSLKIIIDAIIAIYYIDYDLNYAWYIISKYLTSFNLAFKNDL